MNLVFYRLLPGCCPQVRAGERAGLAAPPALMGSHPGHSIQESTNQPLCVLCMLFSPELP